MHTILIISFSTGPFEDGITSFGPGDLCHLPGHDLSRHGGGDRITQVIRVGLNGPRNPDLSEFLSKIEKEGLDFENLGFPLALKDLFFSLADINRDRKDLLSFIFSPE